MSDASTQNGPRGTVPNNQPDDSNDVDGLDPAWRDDKAREFRLMVEKLSHEGRMKAELERAKAEKRMGGETLGR